VKPKIAYEITIDRDHLNKKKYLGTKEKNIKKNTEMPSTKSRGQERQGNRKYAENIDKENNLRSELKQQTNEHENKIYSGGRTSRNSLQPHIHETSRYPLTSVHKKTALRTKSSNSILSRSSLLSTASTRPDLFTSYKNTNNGNAGNFNKARRTMRADALRSSKLKSTLDEKENVGVTKLKVPRNSPEANRVHRKHLDKIELPFGNREALKEKTVDLTASVTAKHFSAFDELTDDNDDDEIEIVPQGSGDDSAETPDGYQPVPKDLLNFVFSKSDTIQKDTLDKFKDPLELDLSDLIEEQNNKGKKMLSDIMNPNLSDDADDKANDTADSSGLGLELKLEFPESGEETEERKLEEIKNYYEGNRGNFKPKRL